MLSPIHLETLFHLNLINMKKSILIVCAVLTTFSLMAFGFLNWNKPMDHPREGVCNKETSPTIFLMSHSVTRPDFLYDIDFRFQTRITKEDLQKATSIIDILPKKATHELISYNEVKVALLRGDSEILATGDTELLNAAQLELLKTADYSTNFYIKADCAKKHREPGYLESYDLVYYMTVTPEKEAEYKDGYQAMLDYLKDNSSKEITIAEEGGLKSGKLFFTITQNGKISNVNLESTSGYKSIDQKMLNLIETLPGDWQPATNSKGEKVDQTLVFSFGIMGC